MKKTYVVKNEAIGHHQASSYIPWDTMLSLVRRLFRDGNYKMSLLIGCGCFFGLRISDLKQLTWKMLLGGDTFTIQEVKTGKKRTIKINKDFQNHIKACHDALHITNDNFKCFISQMGYVYSTQRLNVIFKEIKEKYKLKDVPVFTTHSMRKTFGRRVVDQAGDKAEIALIRLSEIFSHSEISTTRKYLGLREEELMETYDMLDF